MQARRWDNPVNGCLWISSSLFCSPYCLSSYWKSSSLLSSSTIPCFLPPPSLEQEWEWENANNIELGTNPNALMIIIKGLNHRHHSGSCSHTTIRVPVHDVCEREKERSLWWRVSCQCTFQCIWSLLIQIYKIFLSHPIYAKIPCTKNIRYHGFQCHTASLFVWKSIRAATGGWSKNPASIHPIKSWTSNILVAFNVWNLLVDLCRPNPSPPEPKHELQPKPRGRELGLHRNNPMGFLRPHCFPRPTCFSLSLSLSKNSPTFSSF